jgi:hypothetical protein
MEGVHPGAAIGVIETDGWWSVAWDGTYGPRGRLVILAPGASRVGVPPHPERLSDYADLHARLLKALTGNEEFHKHWAGLVRMAAVSIPDFVIDALYAAGLDVIPGPGVNRGET